MGTNAISASGGGHWRVKERIRREPKGRWGQGERGGLPINDGDEEGRMAGLSTHDGSSGGERAGGRARTRGGRDCRLAGVPGLAAFALPRLAQP